MFRCFRTVKLSAITIAATVAAIVSCSTKNDQSPTGAAFDSWDRIAATVAKSVYEIGFLMESNTFEPPQTQLVGTGFAISQHRIITNAHVALALAAHADSSQPVAISCGDSRRTIPLRAYRIHPFYVGTITSSDLAVFVVDSTLADTLTLADEAELSDLMPGMPIGTIGFPGETLVWSLVSPNPTFKDGTISTFMPLDNPDTLGEQNFMMQHNLYLTGGTSGSPIFGLNGHVLAVNNSTYLSTPIGWGVSASCIRILDTIGSLDTFTSSGVARRKTFVFGTTSSTAWIGDLPIETSSFTDVKEYFGYDYTLVCDDDSIMIARFTDRATYQLLFCIEKGRWFGRPADMIAGVCIVNVPDQSAPNAFSSLYYQKRLFVGGSKTTTQGEMGVCSDKKVVGSFLWYRYDAMYGSDKASFLFYRQDEYSSAILLPGTYQSTTFPYAGYFDSTIVPRYHAPNAAAVLPLYDDTTLQVRSSAGVLLAERTYVHGVLQGAFAEYYPDGTIQLSGNYAQGRKQGEFLQYNPSGLLVSLKTYFSDTLEGRSLQFFSGAGKISGADTISSCSFSHGMLSGRYLEFFENGKIFRERFFAAGQLTDTAREYYFDDTLKIRSEYRRDTLDGEYLEYFPDGRLKIHAFYIMGEYDSVYTLYRQSGDTILVQEEAVYKNGQLNGLKKKYLANGSILLETPYVNGVIHGNDKQYTAGILTLISPYENGVRQGLQLQYFPDGVNIRYATTYVDGRIVSIIEYNLAGDIVSEERRP